MPSFPGVNNGQGDGNLPDGFEPYELHVNQQHHLTDWAGPARMPRLGVCISKCLGAMWFKTLLEQANPAEKLKELAELVGEVFQLMPSGKYMVGRDLGRLEPTTTLAYRSAG